MTKITDFVDPDYRPTFTEEQRAASRAALAEQTRQMEDEDRRLRQTLPPRAYVEHLQHRYGRGWEIAQRERSRDRRESHTPRHGSNDGACGDGDADPDGEPVAPVGTPEIGGAE